MFKLCKLITKCCIRKKDTETKKEAETEKQDKMEEEDDTKGPEVEIFKDGDILKDGSPRTQSSHSAKILTEQTDIKAKSKENVAGTKRSHSITSSLVIKKSKHDSGDKIEAIASGSRKGSKDKMATPESRRGSKETAAETSTSRRTSKGKIQVRRSSHSHKTVAVEKLKPSPPQVGNVFSVNSSYLLLYI